MKKNIMDHNLAIILGAGERESKRRAEFASYLLQSAKMPIIVTGGIPKKYFPIQNPKGRSEAEIMNIILRRKGIDPKRIYQETKAQNTKGNFQNSKDLIERLKEEHEIISPKIAIISSKGHIRRALSTAREVLPKYEFEGFPVSLKYGNVAKNLLIEGFGIVLEKFSSKDSRRYRFYNNAKLL